LPGIVVIHNPYARGNLRRPWIADKLRMILGDSGELILTRNIDQLPEVAAECKKRGIEYLGVNGGDGSLHLVLSAFIKVYNRDPLPIVVPLRSGTMNTLTRSVKIKGKTIKILEKLIEKRRSNQPIQLVKQHLIRLNDQYGFMSGGGLAANFLAAYYSGTTVGPWQAIKVLAHAVGSVLAQGPYMRLIMEPAHCKIRIDDEELPPRYFTAFLGCAIREIGLGFTPTPRAYEKPGHFQFLAVIIKPIDIISKIPALWLGRDLNHPGVFSRVAERVFIEPISNIRYTIDGEIYETEAPIDISCGPTIDLVRIYPE